MQTYTLSGIQSMLGLSRAVIAGLIAEGFVTPSRGTRREYRFSFQDVVLLRTAHGLQAAHIPPRKILRALKRLKSSLPAELPMSGLRIAAVGSDVAVREGGAQWDAESGQLLIDFEIQPARGGVTLLGREAAGASDSPGGDSAQIGAAGDAAHSWFERGVELEARQRAAEAERAYREAIRRAPDYVDPYLNLGVLLCDAGRAAEAIDLGIDGLRHQPREALLHFNLAVAFEDVGRLADALGRYETCLRLAPAMADAHYNAARLHEQLGHAAKAIRHYSEYRRLQP